MAPGARPARGLRILRDPLAAAIALAFAVAFAAGLLLARELWSVYSNVA